MPKYVITGVEQATSMSGKKIPSEFASSFNLPESTSDIRPAISLDILDTTPGRPALLGQAGGEYTEVEAVSGSFGKGRGRFETGKEGPRTGYEARAIINRYPMRTAVGRHDDWTAGGSGIQWLGQQTSVASRIELSAGTFIKHDRPGTKRNSWFGMGLGAGMTPVRVMSGRLSGRFLFDLTMLDDSRGLSASHDKLTLEYSRPMREGWIETTLDLEVESVSLDRGSHGLYSLATTYSNQWNENFLLRAGFHGYTGKVIVPPVTTVGNSAENRRNLIILAGLTRRLSTRTAIDIDLIPGTRFETFRSMFDGMDVLDSTTRGVTVEIPIRLRLRLNHTFSDLNKLVLSISHRRERHRPFMMKSGADSWQIVTRGIRITDARVEWELEPHRNLMMTLFGELNDASSSGNHPGSRAPFIAGSGCGSDAIIRLGRVTLNSFLAWTTGAPITFDGDARSPDLIEWNISANWSVKPGLTGRIGIDNLLNREHWKLPDYTSPPLTLWAGIEWRGGQVVW